MYLHVRFDIEGSIKKCCDNVDVMYLPFEERGKGDQQSESCDPRGWRRGIPVVDAIFLFKAFCNQPGFVTCIYPIHYRNE